MKAAKGNPTKTVLTITIGFLVIFIATKLKWALLISLSVGLIGILSDYLSKQIDLLWMKLTYILSLIVPNILLSVIFYLFLFPISLLSKVFTKKDPLLLKNNLKSTYAETSKSFDKKSFENPW